MAHDHSTSYLILDPADCGIDVEMFCGVTESVAAGYASSLELALVMSLLDI
jgi:hypothetical protein